jgi:hypothetical protein
MFQIVQQSASSEQDQLLVLESRIRNAETTVGNELTKAASYRDPAIFKAAANDLSEGYRSLMSVLEGLEVAVGVPSDHCGLTREIGLHDQEPRCIVRAGQLACLG